MSIRFFPQAFCAAAALLLASIALEAEPGDELIKSGDVFDAKLEEAEALKFYLPAEKLQPKNAPLLVSISRQYRHKAVDAAPREEKIKLSGIALRYAQRAAALAPNDSNAQLSVAICYGKLLPFEGTKEQLDASPRIKAAADRAIKLDPRNDLAWHVLGRWHKVLADVGGVQRVLGSFIYGKIPTSTNEAAAKCFEKAIEINPNRLKHYIALGQTYAQMGRVADARRFIEKGLAMPDLEKDDPEMKFNGREALEKLH
jgi:tetratricopeptide (TPR) repeat protein